MSDEYRHTYAEKVASLDMIFRDSSGMCCFAVTLNRPVLENILVDVRTMGDKDPIPGMGHRYEIAGALRGHSISSSEVDTFGVVEDKLQLRHLGYSSFTRYTSLQAEAESLHTDSPRYSLDDMEPTEAAVYVSRTAFYLEFFHGADLYTTLAMSAYDLRARVELMHLAERNASNLADPASLSN